VGAAADGRTNRQRFGTRIEVHEQNIGLFLHNRLICLQTARLFEYDSSGLTWSQKWARSNQFSDGEVVVRAQIKAKLERARVRIPPVVQDSAGAPMMERHYTLNELASMWNLSYEKIRRTFINEVGTVSFGDTYRIPESVARRVYGRLSNR
jgi:hypothetical protein